MNNIVIAYGFMQSREDCQEKKGGALAVGGKGGRGLRDLGYKWLCGYVVMWLCGYVVMWLCGYVVMWLKPRAKALGPLSP
ncbi:hypothetical protein SAMN02745446_02609 [Desulfococcus multivorans DSM 2059]|nr:hypothetical protein SAMN02745446_02609 [Desulfococcus multivorans DSM 2059]